MFTGPVVTPNENTYDDVIYPIQTMALISWLFSTLIKTAL